MSFYSSSYLFFLSVVLKSVSLVALLSQFSLANPKFPLLCIEMSIYPPDSELNGLERPFKLILYGG